MVKKIVFIILLGFSNCWNFCGDWIQYNDIKCIKVLEQLANWPEAVIKCEQLEESSTLISINSKEEQEFFNQVLSKYNTTSVYSWIGLQYKTISDSEGQYKWMDGTKANFQNWANDSVLDGSTTDQCIQMYLTNLNLGKWTDMSCMKKALIVCQKKQKFDLFVLKTAFENMTNVIEKQQNDISLLKLELETQSNGSFTLKTAFENMTEIIERQQNELNLLKRDFETKSENDDNMKVIVENQQKELRTQENEINLLKSQLELESSSCNLPIGYLYIQLPKQKSPAELLPNTYWEDITKDYAGLFFRAEGGQSLPFGEIQQANQSWISDVHLKGRHYLIHGLELGYAWDGYSVPMETSKWFDLNLGFPKTINSLKFYTTDGEVRPENTAIRIWKRIE